MGCQHLFFEILIYIFLTVNLGNIDYKETDCFSI